MEVRLRIEPGALPPGRREVSLRFRERYFGEDYPSRFVEVPGRDGWPRTLGPVRVPTELHYRVSLDLYERGEPRHGRGGLSWRRPGGWHLTGKSFLPDVWVDGEPVEVPAILVLDPGEEPLFTSAGAEERHFDAESLIRLADEAYEVGEMQLTRREARGTTLWIGSTHEREGSLEAAADVIAEAFELLGDQLGAPSTESVLFTLHPVGEEEPAWGERLGSTLVQLSPGGLPEDMRYGLTVSVHEVTHLWLPGTHHVEEEWLAEGVTDYLAVLVANALVGADERAPARVALRAHADYAAGAGQRTLREPHPGDARWVYDAGLVAGFCLDAYLRESQSSLFALLRTTLGRDEEDLGTESLLEDLGALSPDAASYLAALVETRGAFAIDECLERRGLSRNEHEILAWSDRTLAVDVLRIRGLRTLSKLEGFVVEQVPEGSAFEPGDVVLRVADHPVATLDDVAWALRDVERGDRFVVDLRRRGEERRVEVEVGELEEPARAARSYVTLDPREAT